MESSNEGTKRRHRTRGFTSPIHSGPLERRLFSLRRVDSFIPPSLPPMVLGVVLLRVGRERDGRSLGTVPDQTNDNDALVNGVFSHDSLLTGK